MLAHAVDGRDFDAVVAGHGDILEGGFEVVTAEQCRLAPSFMVYAPVCLNVSELPHGGL